LVVLGLGLHRHRRSALLGSFFGRSIHPTVIMVSTLNRRPIRSCRKRKNVKTARFKIKIHPSQSGKFERHPGEIGYNASACFLEREHEDTLDEQSNADADFLVTSGDALYAIWNEGEGEEEASSRVLQEETDEEEDSEVEEVAEWGSDDCCTSDDEVWESDDCYTSDEDED